MDPQTDQVLVVATEAQQRINDAIGAMPPAAVKSSAFGKLGLRDGLSIIQEYVDIGEVSVAADHLIYMVDETGIALSAENTQVLSEIVTALRLRPPRAPGPR